MELLNKYNINPKNIEIYNEALTHPSYANENKLNYDYQRLEFLGDAVIDLVISRYLYEHKDVEEGEMTKYRANYACENAMYKYAKEINLGEYIFIGNGEEKSGGRDKKAILADIFEAFTGAIFMDLGYEEAKKFLDKTVVPHLKFDRDEFLSDYKSELQETVQTDKKSVEYKLVDEEGPSHDRIFTVSVIVDGLTLGTASAGSKKEAEQLAAKAALDKCVK
jgi:ribonuclease-3